MLGCKTSRQKKLPPQCVGQQQKKHDQTFVTRPQRNARNSEDQTVKNIPHSCIIESGKCSSQYKSAQHFDNIQNICNMIGVPIIRLFSVTGHGKGEVNHVEGLAKSSTRQYVGAGGKVLNATDFKDFLETVC